MLLNRKHTKFYFIQYLEGKEKKKKRTSQLLYIQRKLRAITDFHNSYWRNGWIRFVSVVHKTCTAKSQVTWIASSFTDEAKLKNTRAKWPEKKKHQWIKLLYLCAKIKHRKGEWFWCPGTSESVGDHMSQKDFGKRDL